MPTVCPVPRRPSAPAIVQNPSADRCLALQFAELFHLQPALSTSASCSDPPGAAQSNQALSRTSSNRLTKEPDERDGADPSDRTVLALRPADRGTGGGIRSPRSGPGGHLCLGSPHRRERRGPAHQ